MERIAAVAVRLVDRRQDIILIKKIKSRAVRKWVGSLLSMHLCMTLRRLSINPQP